MIKQISISGRLSRLQGDYYKVIPKPCYNLSKSSNNLNSQLERLTTKTFLPLVLYNLKLCRKGKINETLFHY